MGAGKKLGVSTFAFGALVVAVATSSCGWLPKKVSEKDCNDWGDKLSKMMNSAADADFKKCQKAVGGKGGKDVEKAADKAMSKQIDTITKSVVEQCTTQTGKTYIAKDADCYMKADKLQDWANCKFETPFFQDFATMGNDFDKQFLASCEGAAKGGGGSKGDDDDDDK